MPDAPLATSVLLVIDVQNAAFDGARCEPIDRARSLLDNTGALVTAARDAGVPVVFIQHCEGAGEPFEEGTRHGDLHDSLVPRPGEHVVKKRASSAFENTRLAEVLTGLRADELVLCGLQSEYCVSNTARSALSHGLPVVVVEDAHGTWPSGGESSLAISARVNHDLRAGGATLLTTRAAVDRFSRAAG